MPNSSCRPAWPIAARLALGVLLSAGEIAVCWGALHPDVDGEYRAHFIGKPASCWIPPRLRERARARAPRDGFVVKDLVWPESCAILRAGWTLENWGAWSVGPAARLRLPVRPDTRAIVLDLLAPGYLARPQKLGIAAAPGRPRIEAAVPPDGRVSIDVPIGGAEIVDGWVDLDIAIDEPHAPADMGVSADDRLLGVGLLSVHLVGA